jgi:hypothetical protein
MYWRGTAGSSKVRYFWIINFLFFFLNFLFKLHPKILKKIMEVVDIPGFN